MSTFDAVGLIGYVIGMFGGIRCLWIVYFTECNNPKLKRAYKLAGWPLFVGCFILLIEQLLWG